MSVSAASRRGSMLLVTSLRQHRAGGSTRTACTCRPYPARGLKVIQLSEPGLRIVGITVHQDFLETFWASSTHRISAPSSDLNRNLCST